MIPVHARDPFGPTDTEIHFRIGDVNISLKSDLEEVLEDFAVLYGGFRGRDAVGERSIHIEVSENKLSRLRGRRYGIFGDEKRLFTNRRRDEVLPYVEWGINWRVIATRTEYVQLHAATLAYNGQAVVLAGPSGTGKSTLAAGLLSRGWSYLSDEFALINPDTLHVHPFPKALCIKAGAFDLVQRLKLPLWRRRHYVKALKGQVGYVRVRDVARQVATTPCPIRFVIFPKYTEGRDAFLYPISRAQAAFSLTGCAFNRNALGAQAISVLSQVVRNTECFGLESGPIDETCDLIEALF